MLESTTLHPLPFAYHSAAGAFHLNLLTFIYLAVPSALFSHMPDESDKELAKELDRCSLTAILRGGWGWILWQAK